MDWEDTKAKQVKSCDYGWKIAVTVFAMLNPRTVRLRSCDYTTFEARIITDVEPKDLVYPEGWYYAKGHFRNKHQSTTGVYSEIAMIYSDGSFHHENYCTL